MSFKRWKVQSEIEHQLGCTDINQWGNYRDALKGFILTQENVDVLCECAKHDRISYFLKALVSFCQAMEGIVLGEESWAIVRLYYSTFYLLRGDILRSGWVFVRNKGLYETQVKAGEHFTQFSSGKARGDHQLTIRYVMDLVSRGDMIDSYANVDIDGRPLYEWMMLQRERVNYYSARFEEPDHDLVLSHIASYAESNELNMLFKLYCEDSRTYYSADKDHIMVYVPYMKLREHYRDVITEILANEEYSMQFQYVIQLLKKMELQNIFD